MASLRLGGTAHKPYSCAQCEQSFSLRKTLKRHQDSVHGGRAYLCSFTGCRQAFNRKDILERHLSEQHGDEAKRKAWCGVCQKLIHWRVLGDHVRSEAHKHAAGPDEDSFARAREFANVGPLSRPVSYLDLDPFVLTAILWSELAGFGSGKQEWKSVVLPLKLSAAAIELYGRALRSLRRSLFSGRNDVSLAQVRAVSMLAAIAAMLRDRASVSPHLKILHELVAAGSPGIRSYQSIFNDNQLSRGTAFDQSWRSSSGRAWLGRYKNSMRPHCETCKNEDNGGIAELISSCYPFKISWDDFGRSNNSSYSLSDNVADSSLVTHRDSCPYTRQAKANNLFMTIDATDINPFEFDKLVGLHGHCECMKFSKSDDYFLVCDAKGGTVDIVAYESIVQPNKCVPQSMWSSFLRCYPFESGSPAQGRSRQRSRSHLIQTGNERCNILRSRPPDLNANLDFTTSIQNREYPVSTHDDGSDITLKRQLDLI